MAKTTRADKRQFHYVYKTTCTVTGKHYYGMHSTDDLQDGYLGSGTILSRSVKKYGPEAHTCEILEFCDSRESLRLREKEIINEATLKDPMCMNLKLGGHGGFDHIHTTGNEQGVKNLHEHRFKANAKGNESRRDKMKADPDYRERLREQCSISLVKARSAVHEKYGVTSVFKLYGETPEVMEKKKATYAEICHQQGDKNSQFGTCWVYSTTEQKSIKIAKHELDNYLLQGWQKGRKLRF